jgi:hypothetical protein
MNNQTNIIFYSKLCVEQQRQIEDNAMAWGENHTFYGVLDGIEFDAEQLLHHWQNVC